MISIQIIGAVRHTVSSTIGHITDLNCTDNEQSIWNCSYNGLLSYNYLNNNDASIHIKVMVPCCYCNIILCY